MDSSLALDVSLICPTCLSASPPCPRLKNSSSSSFARNLNIRLVCNGRLGSSFRARCPTCRQQETSGSLSTSFRTSSRCSRVLQRTISLQQQVFSMIAKLQCVSGLSHANLTLSADIGGGQMQHCARGESDEASYDLCPEFLNLWQPFCIVNILAPAWY